MNTKVLMLFLFAVVSCKTETKHTNNEIIKQIDSTSTKKTDSIGSIENINNKRIVTAPSGLSIRNKPNLSSEKIGKLEYEDVVEIIEETNKNLELYDNGNLIAGKWLKVKTPETNKQGYAFGGFLNKLDDKIPDMNHYLKYRLQHLVLNNMPVKDSIQYKSRTPSYLLNKIEWQKLGFNALEKFHESQSEEYPFIYNIYNIVKVESGFAFFIERYYDSESYHWLCLLDYDLKLKDHINIAYDNAEGFTGTETHFIQKNIVIDEYNIYEDPEKTSIAYEIKDLKLKKIYH